jgi:tRNA(fMet)-specific endonuclease VapC
VIRVLLDTNVLSEPLREHPHPFVLEQLQGDAYKLHTASVVIHELAYGIQRLSSGGKRRRLTAYLDGLLESGLRVLPYDRQAALWHA